MAWTPGWRRSAHDGCVQIPPAPVDGVGNARDVGETTIGGIAQSEQVLADNPDVLSKVATTADSRRAKREGKAATLDGTQDTSLIGAGLDRISLLKGLGVR